MSKVTDKSHSCLALPVYLSATRVQQVQQKPTVAIFKLCRRNIISANQRRQIWWSQGAYVSARCSLWVVWTRIQGDKTGSCHTLWKLPLVANENSVFDIKIELWIINHFFSKWQTHWINLQLRFSRFWSELLFCKRWAYLCVLLPKATSCDVCICFPCREFWSLSDDTYISRICGISAC